MNHHDVLQRLINGFSLDEAEVAAAFAHGGGPDDGAGPEERLRCFLDGFVVLRRGPRPGPSKPPAEVPKVTENLVLKKLRIALDLKEPDMLAVLAAGGMSMTARQLTPYFRKPGSKHFRKADASVLDAFLRGIAQ